MNKIIFQNRLKTYGLFPNASKGQLEGCYAVIAEWQKQGYTDDRQLSYILATVYHETAKTMQPVEEIGRGKGLPYGSKLKYGGGPNKRIPYTTPDKIYYGRGLTQATWYEVYQKLSNTSRAKAEGWDFLNKPELLLLMQPSAWAAIYAMTTGLYTGKKLSDYFNDKTEDRVNARKIINGLDCAAMIASYSRNFYKCLI